MPWAAWYLLPWAAGGAVGTLGAVLVLRRRGACTTAALVGIAAAWPGFVYGAKLQYRLALFPLPEALRIGPAALASQGFHVPLGLVCAGVAALVVCLLLRAPWRDVGDALAVAGGAMMPIGRIACYLAGCCRGAPCPAWLPFCIAPPPGSFEHAQQVLRGLIPPGAPPVPVHPLPAYFAAASLVILVLLCFLQARRARPGAMLVAFAVLYPLAQLAIEPLRQAGEERPAVIMTTSLLALLAMGCSFGALIVRRQPAGAGARPWPHVGGAAPSTGAP